MDRPPSGGLIGRLAHRLRLALGPAPAPGGDGAVAALAAPPGTDRELLELLRGMDRRLAALEYALQGGRSTYMGQGLVLVKTVVRGINIGLLVEADDRLISPWFIVSGQYETELTEFFADTVRPGDHCLDIGANFGYFTCLLARLAHAGRVIGVEPDPRIHAIARDNVHINGLGGVASARHAAVSDAPGTLTLYRRVGRSGNTSMAVPSRSFTDSLGEAPSVPFDVGTVTVDALVAELGGRVDVMKVDVEGAEPLVFRGAAQAIAANPDLQIVMEWSPGQIASAGFDVPAFVDSVGAMGLHFHELLPGRPVIARDVLLARHYAAGVLITRRPR